MSTLPSDAGTHSWVSAPRYLKLRRDDVHVWRAVLMRPEHKVESLRKLLSDDELDRADRFRFGQDRSNFIVARGILRTILGRYLRLPPSRLRFSYNPFGKPELRDASGRMLLRFGLSHSGSLALYAVSERREVGVDIEYMREGVACGDIAERFFSASEVATLNALPLDARTRAFFECWTRKEAYVKARGIGLSLPLDTFDVSISPGEPPALLSTRDDPCEASRWSIRELMPGSNYVASIAVEGSGWHLHCLQWPG